MGVAERPSATRLGDGVLHQGFLALVLAVEIIIFAVLGTNFLTTSNAFEILRLSVEIGLLALALTPVIITGGIDLSVGSLMGLSAVLFGKMWQHGIMLQLGQWSVATGPLPIALAMVATLAVGALAGGLNAVLITRLRLPPLIVTLGSFSLFRGLAEGITGGSETYTDFPRSFLFLGQGYLPGGIPSQLPIFLVVAVGYWAMLHRTTVGRALFAIGFSSEGARYAGIPVGRRVGLVYVLSGCTASLAAIIYVARLGQARADAGMGYELLAITAVVLGGTSIFGGRGTIGGTLLGLFVLAVLKNGLTLADRPTQLAGILTGVLLLATISSEWLSMFRKWLFPLTPECSPPSTGERGEKALTPSEEEFVVKNSQVAVLSVVILVAALIVAASNWLLVLTLRNRIVDTHGSPSERERPIVVAMMPKSLGNAYFKSCEVGAREAARELGVQLLWDGPTEPDSAKQNEIIETWITRGVDVIAVAVENRAAVSTVLQKARDHGIKVLTWDADAKPEARDFFVNQATPEGIGQALMDNAARVMNGEGEFAIITATVTAANMIEWQKQIEARRQAKYPKIHLALDPRPCDDKRDKAFDEATVILNKYPNVKLIMAICSPAVPGAGEAVEQSKRKDVKVIGLGLPNENKRFVHAGITDTVILWNTKNLGYLTVRAAHDLKKGTLKAGDKAIQAGRLGRIEIEGDNILLGKPFAFNKENIDQFDF
jgi:rhamnose transport system permease protein